MKEPIENPESMIATRALVSVVDDDESVRESLPDLVKEFGFAARAFSSAEEFLASDCTDQTRCLILGVAMPGMSGPDLQRLKQGAVACLFKPFSEFALLAAINTAFRPG
jgi:FixJ family two-component response regulator